MNLEDYECEATQPHIPVRVGRDVQPSEMGDLIVGLILAVILALLLAIGT
jgi:tetrahydromethanopterin S-methyltransferase subunit G|tara:strand:- start:5 stop:154 length:150 start_codon:yes stop_codon:yes gene_type:complete